MKRMLHRSCYVLITFFILTNFRQNLDKILSNFRRNLDIFCPNMISILFTFIFHNAHTHLEQTTECNIPQGFTDFLRAYIHLLHLELHMSIAQCRLFHCMCSRNSNSRHEHFRSTSWITRYLLWSRWCTTDAWNLASWAGKHMWLPSFCHTSSCCPLHPWECVCIWTPDAERILGHWFPLHSHQDPMPQWRFSRPLRRHRDPPQSRCQIHRRNWKKRQICDLLRRLHGWHNRLGTVHSWLNQGWKHRSWCHSTYEPWGAKVRWFHLCCMWACSCHVQNCDIPANDVVHEPSPTWMPNWGL